MKEKIFKVIGSIFIISGIALLINTQSKINTHYETLFAHTKNASLIEKQNLNSTDNESKKLLDREIQYNNLMLKQTNPPPTIESKFHFIYLSIFLIVVGFIPLRNRLVGGSKN